jgi:hypothetical protein
MWRSVRLTRVRMRSSSGYHQGIRGLFRLVFSGTAASTASEMAREMAVVPPEASRLLRSRSRCQIWSSKW